MMNLEKTVNDLPDDVLFEIFAYFSAEELALSIGLVDTRWNRIAHTETLWKRLTFTPSLDMNEQDIEKCLKYMPKLRSFKLRHGKFIDQIVSAMCNYCEDVRTVVMEWKHGPSSDKVHELVKTFPNLERLDVHSPKTQFTIDYAKLFGEFHRKGRITALKNESNHCLNFLEKFIENLPPESDDFMQELKDNKDNLETIAISCEPTTEILHSIGNCSNLKYLFIADNHSEQNDFDVSFLRKLINLETLQLQCFHDAFVFSSTPVSYQIYSNLTKLEMVSCKESFKVIMNDILRHCPTLKQLNIQETHFEDEDLKNISYCKSLTHLDIAVSYYLSDDFIEWVANSCLDLQFLDVSYAERITNNIIYILVPCRHLQCLRMNGIHDMTSTILEIPTLFPQIKELAIKHCKSLFGIIEYHDFNTKEWTGINVVTCSQDYEWCNSSYEQDCESGSTEKDFEKDSAEQDYLSSSIINENNNEFEKFTENGSKEQDLEIPSYEQSHESSSV